MRRPQTPPHARARTAPLPLLAAASVLALALFGAACGGAADADAENAAPTPESTATTEPPTASTTTLTDEDQVLEAVAGYWRTFLEANDPPDPNHPGFDRYFTGEAKAKSTANAASRRDAGLVVRLPETSRFSSSPELVSIDETGAVVRNCLIDDSKLVDRATGRVLNDSVTSSLLLLHLEVVDGRWRVASNFEQERWDGIAGCASE
jgi:hypothetical protein